jgi:excinuclease ABC subunit A
VIVIEHNLDVIKTADWIIDLGPEGGTGGGMIVAEGPPEVVAALEGSHTGLFLRAILGRRSAPTRRTTKRAVGAPAKRSAGATKTATKAVSKAVDKSASGRGTVRRARSSR